MGLCLPDPAFRSKASLAGRGLELLRPNRADVGPSALDLFGPRLVGEALDDLTPAGPLLGETAKIAVVSRLIPAQASASSVVIENLVYILAAVLVHAERARAGVGLNLLRPDGFRWMGEELVICFLASIAVAWWIVSRRILLLGRTLDYLKRVGLALGFSRSPPTLPAHCRADHLRFLSDSPACLSRRPGD